ncbi:hypothetical protein DFA_09619 [Cavenderia fasciculata]|uniref:ComC supersandwich domain-containing protein n=1 Tax=Cavenderia fasciculata TaxID=261658 RepID=F4Q848_CACFS|nr:uncharacterized protein DFA_09619 [Cavenderia fasciculata]EGG15948.1 hypothetical protein DFA_09619 [Cavenderia fasciculata]|eukprot:XP_004352273.1 hypothetical protein DFA_09619 [Cavenderia fasciculata]
MNNLFLTTRGVVFLLLFIILSFHTCKIVSSQPLLPQLERMLIQYGVAAAPQDQTLCQATTYFLCNDNDGDGVSHITHVLFTNNINYASVGEPDPNMRSLYLPQLIVLQISLNSLMVANISMNIFELIKDLNTLTTLSFYSDPTIAIVPPNFTFPLLGTITLENCPNLSNLPPTFLNNSQSLFLMFIFTPIRSMTIDHTYYLPALSSFSIDLDGRDGSHFINITSHSFPKLTIAHCGGKVENNPGQCNLNIGYPEKILYLTVTGPLSSVSPYPITSLAYPILERIVLRYMGLSSFPLVGTYPPKLQHLNLGYNNLGSISSIPSSLTLLILEGNQFISIDSTLISGHPGLDLLNMAYNPDFTGPITDIYCAHILNVVGTSVSSLPDCYWCYKNVSGGYYIVTSLPEPVNFFCDRINIVTNNGQYVLTGQNIGWGSSKSNYTLTKVVPNKVLNATFINPPLIPTNVTLEMSSYIGAPKTQITLFEGGITIGKLYLQSSNTSLQANLSIYVTINPNLVHTVQFDNQNCSNLYDVVVKRFECKITGIQTGVHIVTVSNDYYTRSKNFEFDAPYPKIYSISPLPAQVGTFVQIQGYYGPLLGMAVSFYKDNGQTSVPSCNQNLLLRPSPSIISCYLMTALTNETVDVVVADTDGTYSGSFLVSLEYICQQSTDNCHGNGQCNTTGQCVCNSNGYYNDCSKPYPIISSGSYDVNNTKLVSLYGDFGPYGQSNLSIKINNTLDCTVNLKSQTLITCDLEKTPNYGLSSVQLQLDSLDANVKNILYLRRPSNGGNNGTTTTASSTTTTTTSTSGGTTPDTPQQQCEKQTSHCYGHGICNVNGICQCDKDYNQADNCFTKFINTTITPNTTSPTVSFDIDGIDFQFEVVSIQELDFDSNIVKELFISNYTWIVNASTNNITTIVDYQLNTTLSSIPLTNSSTDINSILFQSVKVLSTISFSTQSRDIQFGDQQLHINANSIKLSVNVTNWQYSSNLATLRVVFRTIIINNQTVEYDCNEKEIDPLSYDSLSSLQYLRVIKDDIQFNGRFIDVALSDGRPTYSQTQLISLTQSTSNEDESIALIGINLPQCQSCVLDPDFSPLLIEKQSECDSKSNTWRIIVGVVVGGVGAIAIATASLVYYKKIQLSKTTNKQMKMKLEKFSTS